MKKLAIIPPYESPSCSVINIGLPARRICLGSIENYGVVPGGYDDDSD